MAGPAAAHLLVGRVRRVAAGVADGGGVDAGAFQNMRSAPQKQPMPTTAVCRPSGNGGFRGVPSTKCRSGTGIGSARPGSASSGATMRVFEANRRMPYCPGNGPFAHSDTPGLPPPDPPLIVVFAGLGDRVEQLQGGGLGGRDEHLAAEVLELREEARVHRDLVPPAPRARSRPGRRVAVGVAPRGRRARRRPRSAPSPPGHASARAHRCAPRRSSAPGGGGCARRARRPPPRSGRRPGDRRGRHSPVWRARALACARWLESDSDSPRSAAPATSTSGTARAGRRPLSAALRARTFAVLDYAYAAGIRDFDVARSYGRGEEFLGEWLRAHNPSGVRVSSKWGYVYTAGWEVAHDPPEVKHHDLSTFRRQLAETRENLGEWLTLYQIHSATPESGVLSNDAVLSGVAGDRPSARRQRQRHQPVRDDRPRAVARPVRRDPGHLEPARAGRRATRWRARRRPA